MTTTYDDLTADQRSLHDEVRRIAGWTGKDCRDVLLKFTAAPDGDRAAVADVLGGPGAGEEFRR